MSRRRDSLSAEELALWSQVTASVTPLRQRRAKRKVAGDEAEGKPDPAATRAPTAAAPQPLSAQPKTKRPPPLTRIDPQEKRRLIRGTRGLDARLDLHGMRQAEAHEALRRFLSRAQVQGHNLVLVITGKGQAGGLVHAEGERGVLRRMVPHWLGLPDLRPLVVGFEEAHRGHGGSGAIYVRLRRARGAVP
jgi:DNA-nicking Smr family endonuclease